MGPGRSFSACAPSTSPWTSPRRAGRPGQPHPGLATIDRRINRFAAEVTMGLRFPISMTLNIAGYMAKKKLSGTKKFPLVLMLEPLHACNLTCTGCGRIREYESTIKQKLSVEECLASVEECGAPIVSICGGEPMIYPEIGRLVHDILKRRKHIYLCTNGMFT